MTYYREWSPFSSLNHVELLHSRYHIIKSCQNHKLCQWWCQISKIISMNWCIVFFLCRNNLIGDNEWNNTPSLWPLFLNTRQLHNAKKTKELWCYDLYLKMIQIIKKLRLNEPVEWALVTPSYIVYICNSQNKSHSCVMIKFCIANQLEKHPVT